MALTQSFGEPLGPVPAPLAVSTADDFEVLALGDSLTVGSGDAREGGYAARVAASLRKKHSRLSFRNLAVPGAETGDLLKQLEGVELQRRIRNAQLILLSIGGNDLNHALRSTGGNAEPEEALTAARANLLEIVKRIRAINTTRPLRLIGLYNPFEILAAAEPEARAQLLSWNHAIETATNPFRDVLAVPVADIFANRPDRLAGDRFHPGSGGHGLIAQRVISTLNDPTD